MMKNLTLTKLKRSKSAKPTKTKKSVHWSEKLEEIHYYNPGSDNFASKGSSLTKVLDSFASETKTTTNKARKGTTQNTNLQPQYKLESMQLSTGTVHASIMKSRRLAFQNILAVKQESECFEEDWV